MSGAVVTHVTSPEAALEVVEARHGATVDAPAAAVWPYFDWPNLGRMVGDGLFVGVRYDDTRAVPGATRVVELASGACLTEVLEACDATTGRFVYRILDNEALPVRDYRGEVVVTALDAGHARVEFTSRCRLVGIDAAAWRALYAEMQSGFLAHIAGQLATRGR